MLSRTVPPPDVIAARAAARRARFVAEGENVSEWARRHGFPVTLVFAVLKGDRPGTRGESHRVAVALGIKDPPPSRSCRAASSEGARELGRAVEMRPSSDRLESAGA